MKAGSLEWIEKAEADFVSAGREYRARKQPNYSATRDMARQAVKDAERLREHIRRDMGLME